MESSSSKMNRNGHGAAGRGAGRGGGRGGYRPQQQRRPPPQQQQQFESNLAEHGNNSNKATTTANVRLESAEEFEQRRKAQQQARPPKQPQARSSTQSHTTGAPQPQQPQQQQQRGPPQQQQQPRNVQQQQQQQRRPAPRRPQPQQQQETGDEGGASASEQPMTNQNAKRRRNKRQKQDKASNPDDGAAAAGPAAGEDAEMDEGGEEEAAPPKAPSSSLHLAETKFESLTDISANARKALKEHLKFERMTVVQEATLPAIAAGKDVLAKAKTGTGKTIAFLLHVLDRLAARPSRGDPSAISVLILSPTRELACQIEQEAKDLLFFQPKGRVEVEVMYGGYPVTKDLRRFNEQRAIDVLVATPGRLEDHLQNAPGVKDRLARHCQVLILDEADQLLEMGFRPAIERIVSVLPKTRQTLLFTATVPQQMHSVLSLAMKKDHVYIDCVGETAEQTNAMVKQQFCIVPLANQLAALEVVINDHIAQNKQRYKIIVFFATARAAGYHAAMFEQSGMSGVLAIHSRKSQAQRTKASDAFKNGNKLVLFSSDVSARGLDYPDVSLVVQVGYVDREQYIHRVGRTARAGASGEGLLILAPFEQYMLRSISDLPCTKVPDAMATRLQQATPSVKMQGALNEVAKRDTEVNIAAQQAYQAWLGFYKGQLSKMKWAPAELVKVANEYSAIMGLREIPALQRKTVGMMGLKGVPGLRIE